MLLYYSELSPVKRGLRSALLLILATIELSATPPSNHFRSLPNYRKHRIGLGIEGGGSFLLPDQPAGLAAVLEAYYCKDLGEHLLAESGAGVRLTSLHTRFGLDGANHEDSTASINSLSIPLRLRYVISRWNVAPTIGLSYECRISTGISIDSVEQGKQGAWLKQARYNSNTGVAAGNLDMQLGVSYMSPNRRTALGFLFNRNLLDWASDGYPEARAWGLSLRIDVTFGLDP